MALVELWLTELATSEADHSQATKSEAARLRILGLFHLKCNFPQAGDRSSLGFSILRRWSCRGTDCRR